MKARKNRNRWLAGAALIGIGLLLLVAQLVEGELLGRVFLLLLGGIFILWGILSRQIGLLIPGGILSGLGLGVWLITGPFHSLEEADQGGVFLLAFALGWGLISLLSLLFTERVCWWPLIPGGILALIGGGLLWGEVGRQVLEWVGKLWPVALIAVGLYLLLGRRR